MRRRSALALLLACALLAGVPAAAHAGQVVFHAAATPSDYWYGYQWGMENAGPSTLFPTAAADADIDAQQAWDDGISGQGAGITVAVVDTRIDTTNPDIATRIVTPDPAFTASKNPDCPAATPPPDHGTAVAGIVAAAHDGHGIAGVAPEATILPVPALDDCGGGTKDAVLNAFRYAVDDHHADIVVASFATDPLLPKAQRDAIAAEFDAFFAEHGNTLFVVAAGNEGNDDDTNPVYPCSSQEPNVLCVGASAMDDSPACESNVGKKSVDLFAPGERMYSDLWSAGSTRPQIGPLSGTSMAAPMAAGVAALVASTPLPHRPLADQLRATVDPRAAMATISEGGGRLNAAVALGLQPDAGALRVSQGRDWKSCDADHDGVIDSQDDCPDTPAAGTTTGCPPDSDGDGVADASDNCPAKANPGQADADRDGIGDACDATPRGADADGDGVGALDDRCPTQYARTADGCPAPPPPPPPVAQPTPPPVVVSPPPPVVAPRIVSVAVRVAHSRRSARVTVRLSRTLRTSVTVERRVRRHHRHVWRRVLRRSVTFTARGRAMTARTKARGRYRVTVRLAGARTVRRMFRV